MFGFQPYNNYNNMFQNPIQIQQPMGGFQTQNPFITRQVTNIEEAKAFIIDPINTYLFIDVNAGKIYMKKMNNNGLSDFFTFGVLENATEKKSDPLSEINQRLINIENKLGGINNVQSVSDDVQSGSINAESNDRTNAETEPTTFSKSSRNDKR